MINLPSSAPPIRVLVVDDSAPFREATRELIDATSGFEWIGDASCGEEGVEQSARLEPDLVLMDVRMPGIGGVEAARRIVGRASAPVVVLITCSDLSSVPDRGGVELLAKDRLSPSSLRRVWQELEAGSRAPSRLRRGSQPAARG